MDSYCLKWDHFSKNIAQGLSEERSEGDFVDVAIAVEGGHVIHAHKLVLSVSSSFFKTILKANAHPYPLLYIHGITLDALMAILDFMYSGEVKVCEDRFNSFLKAAEILGVKGLASTAPKDKYEEKLPLEADEKERAGVKSDGEKNIRAESDGFIDSAEKSDGLTDSAEKSDETNSGQQVPAVEVLRGEKLNQVLESFCIKEGQKKLVCGKCGKTFAYKRKLMHHIERHFKPQIPLQIV